MVAGRDDTRGCMIYEISRRPYEWNIIMWNIFDRYIEEMVINHGDFFWLSEGPLETLLFLRSLNGIWKSCHDFDPRSNEEDFYKSYKLKFHYVGGMEICSKLCEISHKGWRLFFSSDLFFEKFLSIIDRILLNDK